MASGFPGGDPGFYGGGRRSLGNGFLESNTNGVNSGNGLYRFQQQQQQLSGNPGQQIGYRRPDLMMGKRSLAEYQASSNLPPQSGYFQQAAALAGGGGAFLRSMKQRTGGFNGGFQNHALSPISPLSPSIDLCSPGNNSFDHNQSAPLSSVSSLSGASSARYGAPLHHHHQPNLKPNNPGTENGNQTSMKATLQDLEKYLFDDDDDEKRIGGGETENDAVSAITNNNNDDWSQTFQDLISPSPTATAAAAATTVYTSPTNSTSSCSSSKTPPPPPLLAPTPPPPAKPKEIIAEAAMAIVDGKSDEINETLARLAQTATPTGDPEQRMAYYMLHALRCRVSPGGNPPPVGELYSADHLSSVHALYELSPCFKFALLSSNILILEAIASTMQENNNGAPKVVHIVDFDVGHGIQYVNLLRALVERGSQTPPTNPPFELKITAVETETSRNDEEATKRVEAVRGCLMRIAAEEGKAARFTLTFNSVARSIGELTRDSIGCGPDETLLANFAFRLYRVPDESVSVENYRDELLRRVRAMRPRVVMVAEQELSANTAPFAARVGDCASYYGALLESLELARESPGWARVEEAVGRKAANVVACEGRERVERCEVFGKWRARMGMAGFKLKPVNRGVEDSMRVNLTNPARGGSPSFTVKEENGGVCFGWMGRTLTVASAWR